MAKAKKEKQSILKKGKAMFSWTGEAKINDYTYDLNKISENSGYKYSRLNLGVEIQNGHILYGSMMGGLFPNNKDAKGKHRENVIYVNDKDDFTNNYKIDFEDRKDPAVLEGVNGMNFIQIGIEKTDEGKTHVEKFLSEYDAIPYIQEHLEEGTVIKVNGNLEYQFYNDEVKVNHVITGIYLSKAEPENYRATFVQSILIDNDSIDKKNATDSEIPIFAKVVDYMSKYKGKEIKESLAFPQEYVFDISQHEKSKLPKIFKKFLSAKRGKVTEVAVEGEFRSSVDVGEVNEGDISAEMQELIDIGILSEEEVLKKMVVRGDSKPKMVITKPYIKKTDEGLRLFVEQDKYNEEDILTVFQFTGEEEKPADLDTMEEPEEEDNSWLEDLGSDE